MKIACVYIHPSYGGQHDEYARRFAYSLCANPPGCDGELIVVQNGPGEINGCLPFLKYEVFKHSNEGWDIGAYIAVAKTVACDILVCFGQSTWFNRPGWLVRIRDSFVKHGPGLYGATASYQVQPHIQTTGFWCSPSLLAQYPYRVVSKDDRYNFEHGRQSITGFALKKGLPVSMATLDGEWDISRWRFPANVYWKGNQSNVLFWHNHMDSYDASPPDVQRHMTRIVDGELVEQWTRNRIEEVARQRQPW